MLRFVLVTLLALACTPASLLAKDYTLLKKLPARLTTVKKKLGPEWESGVTPRMREATGKYNQELEAMLSEVTKAYYAKDAVSAAQVEEYVQALHTVRFFKQLAGNPSGEPLGTQAPLDVASEVSTALEETVAEMVEAVVADDETFDLEKWRAAWDQATTE